MPATERARLAGLVLGVALAPAGAQPPTLPEVIDAVRPAVVGVGTVEATRRPPNRLLGSGFAVADGTLVVTNAHVVSLPLATERREFLAVFTGRGRQAQARVAEVLAKDERHDLAVLSIAGEPLPALVIAEGPTVREGTAIAFTGFPIGAVLGLYPVTHTGIVSALTPIIIPARDARELTVEDIRFLREPFEVLQLDATAYPGNSGSPVYDARSGEVVGVVNQVFVKGKKEDVLKDPSGITYAIPATHIGPLVERALAARARRDVR